MAVNQQRKTAMKRLARDLVELQQQPVENVSAEPLENNMLEWHCNFKHDDIIYHLILFLTDKYPYESPSAEFVPGGFRYNSGATMPGKKGTKVCLNIFSDFAYIHTEWKDQKGVGWSPGYTVQTILMNVVAFLAETQTGDNCWMKDTSVHNLKLSKNFKCKDCGHTYKKPFPPLESKAAPKAKGKGGDEGQQIIDYMSKDVFKAVKPAGDGDLWGYGLIVSGPPHRPALTSPCEFVQAESYNSMKKAIGKVHSVMKEEVKFFLPLYIHVLHGQQIKASVEATLNEIAAILPKCKPGKTPIEEMVIKVIPNLMSATVVEFSKGTQHTSDNSLNGYFALHRLFLWALDTYPDLQGIIDTRLKDFIADEANRTKKACPHIGEWLMLLSGSWKYRWEEAGDAYLSESWKRQVMWYVKEDSKLGMLDTDQKYRLEQTLARTAVSRKLLAFQVLFLDIAMPKGKSRKELIKRYDDNQGFPDPDMVRQMKESVDTINNMKTFTDWFKVLKLKAPSDKEIYDRLVKAVEYSIWTDGYNWSFWKTGGGWGEVLKLKAPSDKEIYDRLVKAVEYSIWTDGYNWSFWKTGGGWGEVLRRYKPYTPKDKSKDGDKGAKDAKAKGKAPVKGPAVVKGKGRGKKAESSDDESEEEDIAPKGRGRGKAKKEPAPKPVGKKAAAAAAPRGKGRGRGAAKKAEPMDVDNDDEEEEPKPKGRGRGGAKRKADEALGKGAGRGRKKKK